GPRGAAPVGCVRAGGDRGASPAAHRGRMPGLADRRAAGRADRLLDLRLPRGPGAGGEVAENRIASAILEATEIDRHDQLIEVVVSSVCHPTDARSSYGWET